MNKAEQRKKAGKEPLWLWSLISALVLRVSYAPLEWWPLAWFAPAGWLLAIERADLKGKRIWFVFWFSGFAFWLLMLRGICMPHWSAGIGWLLLCAYLGIYIPLFISVSRAAVHEWKVPLPLAAATVWTALEYLRGFSVIGFSGGLLAHSQVKVPLLIQSADLAGGYLLSFLMVFTAGCLTLLLRRWLNGFRQADYKQHRQLLWGAIAIFLMVANLTYGYLRMEADAVDKSQEETAAQIKVALLQQPHGTKLVYDPQLKKENFLRYKHLGEKVYQDHPDIDLFIWPESAYSIGVPELRFLDPMTVNPVGQPVSPEVVESYQQAQRDFHFISRKVTADLKLQHLGKDAHEFYLLLGTGSNVFEKDNFSTYNASLLLNDEGEVIDRYYKMKRVVGGEYIPLGDQFPWLYQAVPFSPGLQAGKEPRCMQIKGVGIATSICFESTVPHLIRSQINQLESQGEQVDLLVNQTNDGWFWETSVLDIHQACAVFRAVENRKPFLVAANVGITCSIDSNGRIRESLPRMTEGYLLTEVGSSDRFSLYQQIGDWFALILLFISLFWFGSSLWTGWSAKKGEKKRE